MKKPMKCTIALESKNDVFSIMRILEELKSGHIKIEDLITDHDDEFPTLTITYTRTEDQ